MCLEGTENIVLSHEYCLNMTLHMKCSLYINYFGLDLMYRGNPGQNRLFSTCLIFTCISQSIDRVICIQQLIK